MSKTTVRRYRKADRMKLATYRVTVHFDANDLALLLTRAVERRMSVGDPGDLTEKIIREVVEGTFSDAVEEASFYVGDNSLDDLYDEVHARIVDVVFGGQEKA